MRRSVQMREREKTKQKNKVQNALRKKKYHGIISLLLVYVGREVHKYIDIEIEIHTSV